MNLDQLRSVDNIISICPTPFLKSPLIGAPKEICSKPLTAFVEYPNDFNFVSNQGRTSSNVNPFTPAILSTETAISISPDVASSFFFAYDQIGA